MPKFLSQKGIAPIILIIILTIVIAGVSGAVYNSRKEIKIRSDKTSETAELKSSSVPNAKDEDVAADKTGRLAEKSVELKADNKAASSPKFSITPPAGWEKLAPNENIVVEFLSPSKDVITEGIAIFDVQPNITVFVAKADFKNLDEAVEFVGKQDTNSGYQVNSRQKTKINGEDAYAIESTIDIADLARSTLESKFKQEIAKSGKKISEEVFKKDLEKVLQQAKGRVLSYAFYKNGYYINVTGKSLDSFWDKRVSQLKRSMDTFKFE